MREEIKGLLQDGRALDFLEISNELKYSRKLDSTLANTLSDMVNNYELTLTKKKKYMLFDLNEKNKNYVKGTFLDTKSNVGFVRVEGMDGDIYIPGNKTMGALDGDTVLVYIKKTPSFERKAEGEVKSIIKREVNNKVGEVYHYEKKIMVSLDDKKNNKLIYLDNTPTNRRLVDGDKVVVSFIGMDNNSDYIKATLVKRIGHINDPGIDILSIIAEHEIDVDFSSEALLELESIPTEVKRSEIKGLHDLRDKMIFTIDGDDTKDIDDAISVSKLDNGNYNLGVHIAHVSHYIKENSALDLEARKRGTSTYLVDRVLPMFPHQISNGICSLNPGVDRLTITCDMEISDKGKLIKYDIYPSVIKSRKQMTYNKVNEILEKNTIPEGYEEYADTLKLMNELAHIIRGERTSRGSIDFDTEEAKILVDENCVPTEISLRYRGEGERLIEDFMVRANETVATHFYNMDLPSVYRVHGEPSMERLIKFLNIINALGMNIKLDSKKMSPMVIQKLVNDLKKRKEFKVLSTRLLSSMDKAIYSPNNIGHFALASKIYTHFTSPIRRYPDLTIHRLLDNYFFSEDGITNEKISHFMEVLPIISDIASEKERNSDECERDVEDMKMAEYMEKHIGEVYHGMVSGVTNFGIFVMLDNMVEGLVPIEDLGNNYSFDKELEILKVGNKVYRLGDELSVKIISSNKDTSEIDFKLAERSDDNEENKKED